MITTPTPAKPREAPPRRSTNRLLWSAQILLAALFVFAAIPKLAAAHSAVHMFGQIGAGQWLRYLVGTAEMAGAIGLLIPRLAGLAAAGLAADMAGATIINAAVLHSSAAAITVPLCAAFALLARCRWQQAKRSAAAIRLQSAAAAGRLAPGAYTQTVPNQTRS